MRPPLSAAYGGGGFFGIGYGLGVAHGLRDGGVDLTGAPALGTSAGSWVASAMVLDIGFDEFDALPAPAVPDRRPGLLAATAAVLFGDARSPSVGAVVVALANGQRRVLRGDRYALADLCAASSAIPAVFAPHRLGRRRYLDGGVRSGASADLAAPADHLVAVVPIGGAVFRGAGRGLDALLGREVAAWRRRNPGARVTVVRPNRAIAGHVGLDPRRFFDAALAGAVYPLAREQGRRWADRILRAAARRPDRV